MKKMTYLRKAGNNKLKMLAVVPAALAVVLMLVLASGFVQVPTATVMKNQLAPEEHCMLCDYLQAQYSGGGYQWTFNGTLEEYNAKYGEVGGRQLMLQKLATCPGGSNPLDAIIAEYEATGSLDNFFAPLYSYVISSSISADMNIGEAIQGTSQQVHLNKILFSVPSVPHVTNGIPSTSIKTHYTYEDLGITYAEIYQRALDMRAWLEGGSYPSWAGDPTRNNAELDCLELSMVATGVAKCVILPIILLAPILFGLPIIMKLIQMFSNYPELINIGAILWNTCVTLDSIVRAGLGLPP